MKTMIEKEFGELKTDDTIFCDADRNYYFITEVSGQKQKENKNENERKIKNKNRR